MLKATSLFYSLIILLLIGALLTVLLLVTSASKTTVLIKEIENDLLDLTESNISFGLENYADLDFNEMHINPFGNEFNFSVEKERWGMFELLKCKSYLKQDTLKKGLIVGKMVKDNLGLYLTDNDRPLLIGGSTKIIGDVIAPNEGVKKLNLIRKNLNDFLVNGIISKSKKELPKLRYQKNVSINTNKSFIYKELNVDKMIQRDFFSKATIVLLNKEQELSTIKISGKYIIKSDSLLRIKKSAQLEDVIIVSPRVIVESGFQGNIQIFATESIVIEKGVYLTYPSFVFLENHNQTEGASILISEDSKVLGGVLLITDKRNRDRNKIVIKKNAVVAGDVYSSGTIELKGAIYGTTYTNSFYLNTGEAEYDNAILNGKIDGNLPKEFIRLNFVENNKPANYQIIKVL